MVSVKEVKVEVGVEVKVPAVLLEAEVVNCERDVLPLPWSHTTLWGLQGKVFNGQIGQQGNFLVLDLSSPLLKT